MIVTSALATPIRRCMDPHRTGAPARPQPTESTGWVSGSPAVNALANRVEAELLAQREEPFPGHAVPLQVVERRRLLLDRRVAVEPRQRAVEENLVPPLLERRREPARVADVEL